MIHYMGANIELKFNSIKEFEKQMKLIIKEVTQKHKEFIDEASADPDDSFSTSYDDGDKNGKRYVFVSDFESTRERL